MPHLLFLACGGKGQWARPLLSNPDHVCEFGLLLFSGLSFLTSKMGKIYFSSLV